MIDLEKVDLHDALIKAVSIDYAAKTVVVDIELYKDSDTPARVPASIVFEAVESISQISDVERLQKNAFAGNVSYWIPAQEGGTTYIYLADGCIAIKAGRFFIPSE